MNSGVILTLLLLTTIPPLAKEPPMAKKTGELVSDLSQYSLPQGWTAADDTAQGDPLTTLSKGLHTIKIRLSGGPASRYKTPDDFLAGFEARSNGGKRAEKIGTAAAAGALTVIYRRNVPVRLPSPDAGGPAEMTREEFCVVPAGNRFLILTYSYGDAIPDPDYDGSKVWRHFLKNFKLKKKLAGK